MGQRFCEEPVIHTDFDMRVFDGAASGHACLEYPMPKNAKFKTLVRARMESTGDTYTQAREALLLEKTTQPSVEAAATAPTTLDRIRAVLEEYPNLCDEGICVHPSFMLPKEVSEDRLPLMSRARWGTEEAKKQAETLFSQSRERLLTEDAVRQVEAVIEFMRPLRRMRPASVPKSTTAMHSKWLSGQITRLRRDDAPISHGATLVGCVLGGFPIYRPRNSRVPECMVGASIWDVVKMLHAQAEEERAAYTLRVSRDWLWAAAVIATVYESDVA